jgi:hypothetical protein
MGWDGMEWNGMCLAGLDEGRMRGGLGLGWSDSSM